jgi:hypothetical protein
MSVGDVWQEHRRFITMVGAGGLVVFIAWLIISSVYSGKAQRLTQDIERARRVQKDSVLPGGADIKKIQSDRDRLEKDTEALVTTVGYKPDDKWLVLPSVADPDLHYNKQIDAFRNGVLELAALRNIDVDQKLGLPETFPGSRAEIEHYLRGLAVVEAVVGSAVVAEGVHEGGVARIEKIEISRPPKARTGTADQRKTPFIPSIKVDMTVVGHPKAIDLILKNFAADTSGEGRAGHYLSLEEASVKSLDLAPGAPAKEKRGADPADHHRVECRMSILALNVNPEGQIL